MYYIYVCEFEGRGYIAKDYEKAIDGCKDLTLKVWVEDCDNINDKDILAIESLTEAKRLVDKINSNHTGDYTFHIISDEELIIENIIK